jgi:acetylornithine aminotransferase
LSREEREEEHVYKWIEANSHLRGIMEQQTIIEQAEAVMATTYKRFPVVLTRGEGCTVWDAQGRAYTDFIAGIAVCSLGHCHPAVTEAICRQAGTLCHVSNLYYTVPQVELARWLVDHSFADRVFFCNSGAEANEAAIKLARKYFFDRGQPERYHIVAMNQSFHGRTLGTLSATGQEKIRKGFAPVLERFDFVPFGDIEALRRTVSEDTCAVMLEPIQGEGGVNCPPPGYLAEVRALCDRVGALLIYDEIQTGMGRTGTLFAYMHEDIAPDIMTLAKALANGLPIGAMCAREAVAAAFTPGAHATTFGGTPLVTAAALATARTLVDGGVLENGRAMGDYFKTALEGLRSRHGVIVDVRGRGLLLGVELDREGAPVVNACLEKGFLVNCIQDKVLRLAPPLVVGREQIDALVACLDQVLP